MSIDISWGSSEKHDQLVKPVCLFSLLQQTLLLEVHTSAWGSSVPQLSIVWHGHFCSTRVACEANEAAHPWFDRCTNCDKSPHVEHQLCLRKFMWAVLSQQDELILQWTDPAELPETGSFGLQTLARQATGIAWLQVQRTRQIGSTHDR